MAHIHLIGVGGTGLSAIARILLEMGYMVTGSDRAESPFTLSLQAAGVRISIGHSADNIQDADLVVRSSAIPDDNPEVIAARNLGIPVLKRADFLGSLMAGKIGIAIAGTHGKTTTASMVAWILSALGQEPSFIVGGVVTDLGTNARSGKGSYFVIEADEYDRMFLGLQPSYEIVTYVEHDHPDCYPTAEDFAAAFHEFVRLLPDKGVLIASAEDQGTRSLILKAREMGKSVLTYGMSKASGGTSISVDTYIENYQPNDLGGFTFSSCVVGNSVRVALKVPGIHNILNAIAVLTLVHQLGLDLELAAQKLGDFQGTGRRFELKGEVAGIVVIDDYAHHPTEIRATLAAARARFPGHRIWAVWQPHTYSRTITLLDGFLHSFEDADEVLVTEVYASREKNQDFSAKQIVINMPHLSARYSGSLENTVNLLISDLRAGDVVLVLSAGDADQVSNMVLAHFKENENG
jgi:UDP-N-acetylmuramate--alanine ligase